ncbi:kinase-like domain-containing protein [Rhizophagus irregularis DAOM 181602=DAOM 197198]|uniref:Kinase-like domain-containing protein n=1 Tax=Rhizophagus irregularis (strain DAOM 181602 / DAOM 197198 / MUCL 43194) TaxID=747089 RepID=A0A2P4QJS3_RHIID|nr:kinase-like domain-containing protein [Rhizophagus irregularis DAOM 181602=DAOM 197198]POG77870.1 kinase-like domain-containing protein [Rhizophagus irregularis DAOM 181602=DAOM 197198]|eukprot:XP_025184736.1 kinase-like domain-containing protein [Rhizophagus irregularis DAOM 181602=DAOM 197198]
MAHSNNEGKKHIKGLEGIGVMIIIMMKKGVLLAGLLFIIILLRRNGLGLRLNIMIDIAGHLWEYHKRCLNSIDIIKFYGFTRNPDTLNYMVVIDYANKGNLRGNLTKIIKKNWKQKLHKLYEIISGLSKIHREDLIHCDFHDGNILIHVESDEDKIFISDLGLCRPVKSFLKKDDIYGVIPFMAPEILRGKSYTPASDIYSFSMIMWEFTSGVPPFNNRAHDIQLSISICKGERPEIIENTPQCYVDLMKMCWNEDPLKRPSSREVLDIVGEWIFFPENGIMNKGLKSNVMEFINAPIGPNNLATESHPQVYYISRLLNFSSKELNETLKSKDLQTYYASHSTSGKVDEMLISFESEDLQSYYASQSTSGKVNEIPVSEDLDDCIIIDIND